MTQVGHPQGESYFNAALKSTHRAKSYILNHYILYFVTSIVCAIKIEDPRSICNSNPIGIYFYTSNREERTLFQSGIEKKYVVF